MKVTINLRHVTQDFLAQLYFLLRNSELHANADDVVKEIRRRGINPHDLFEGTELARQERNNAKA